MAVLTILLTFIQFGIMFYLFFSVITIKKRLDQQQIEHNQMFVLLKKLMEVHNK